MIWIRKLLAAGPDPVDQENLYRRDPLAHPAFLHMDARGRADLPIDRRRIAPD